MFNEILNRYDKQIHRFLEILLGTLTWGFLTSPVWLGILYPPAIVYTLTLLTVYWCYMAFKHTWGLGKGYNIYKKEITVDWWGKCKELTFSILPDKPTLPNSLSEVKHLIVIPVVNESEKVIEGFINSLLDQSFPINQITLAFTIEEKFAKEEQARILKVFGDRVSMLGNLFVYIHPGDIFGEAKGDGGANRSWGCKNAVE